MSGTEEPAAPPDGRTGADALVLHLDGFEGPLDLLLDLARAQKVDLARISILALVEQYLAVIEGARRVRLELAADWLVMAAWLAWLKSRLFLPDDPLAAEEGEEAAEVLAARLRELLAIRAAASWLGARPVLGQDVFGRGAPENLIDTDRSRLALDLPGLMRAYLAAARRAAGTRKYRPVPVKFWTIQDALGRLAHMLGSLPDWTALERFLPDFARDQGGDSTAAPVRRKAALASTLIASLELARDGKLRLRQDHAFGPILVRGEVP